MKDTAREQEQLLEYYRGCTPIFRRKLMDYAVDAWMGSESRRAKLEEAGVSPDSIETCRDELIALYDLCDEFGQCEVETRTEIICRNSMDRRERIDSTSQSDLKASDWRQS